MTRAACDRWTELSDAAATEAALSLAELEFLRGHEETCVSCASEASAWRALEQVAVPAPPASGARLGDRSTPRGLAPDDALDEEVERILRAASTHGAGPSRSPRPSRRATRIAVFAAPCVAAAAVVALLVHRPAAMAPRPAGAVLAVAPSLSAAASSSAGSSSFATRSLVPAVPRDPGGCRQLAEGITACTSAGAELATERMSPPHRVLDLVHGRVVIALAPQPSGMSFGVATPAGVVTAVGTVFAVEVADDATTSARVERGEVLVFRARDRQTSHLREGEALRLDLASLPLPLGEAERMRDLVMLDSGTLPPMTESVRAPIEDTPPAAVRAPRRARDAGAEGAAAQGLARARALRSDGSYAAAVGAYRAVYEAHPRSPEGGAALVSAGELLLSELRDPSGALGAFDAYLIRGGTLAREARYGRIGALQALGRADDERSAIDSFLRAYPEGPEAEALRRRLAGAGGGR